MACTELFNYGITYNFLAKILLILGICKFYSFFYVTVLIYISIGN